MDPVTTVTQDLREKMEKALQALQKDLSGLRTGRASPSLLEPLVVEAYGGRMPLNQLGAISAPEPRLLMVHVWDASMVSAVEKAIRTLNLTPAIEGTVLRIPLPELSRERREELVKKAKSYAEDTRVGLRNARHEALNTFSKDEISEDVLHTLKKEVQKITDDFGTRVEDLLAARSKDILTV